jgi:hypothetical protein
MLKDRNGKTVCPTLLNTECRFCHKLGHTAKFCDAPKKKEKKEKERSEYKPKTEKTANPNTNISNKFQGLSNDDSDDEEKEEESPILKPEMKCWATIAAKPQKISEVIEPPKDYVVLTRTDEQTLLRNMYRRNWAEWPDSEDDE